MEMTTPLDPTTLPAWHALTREAEALQATHLRELFAADSERVPQLTSSCGELLVDFSKQRVTARTMALLHALAREAGVDRQIAGLYAGATVNVSEGRAALHMALRADDGEVYHDAGRNVVPEVQRERERMRAFCSRMDSDSRPGTAGRSITDVVNLGIGGSDLGPRMAAQALCARANPMRRVHFVSNIDGADLASLLAGLDPRRTLFIVVSKTFTTQETLANARSALAWARAGLPADAGSEVLAGQFVAITANVKAAAAFGIAAENIFAFWEWVGGRYSLWSAVGLSLALANGMDDFEAMLAGAREMDRHFRDAPAEQKLPLTLALLEVWNSNFLAAQTRAVIPYSRSLHLFPSYLQQLEMESNGKSVGRDGQRLHTGTSPIVWGSAGSDAQHAYFQLLHQGGRLVPCDFIAFAESDFPLPGHHDQLLANCFAQSEALMHGRTEAEARRELANAGLAETEIARLLPHKIFAGNQPSTTILLPSLSPRTLGMLIALYEHKVFAAAALWGINPFDQWGVELGKQLATQLLPALTGSENAGMDARLNPSTRQLIAYCHRYR